MAAQPRARTRELVDARCDDEPGLAVVDDVERPTCVGRRQHGLLREERLEGNHAEVLVDRGVVDTEAACVEIGELLVRDPAGELGAAVEAAVARDLLEPLAVGAVAGDHDTQPRLGGGRLEQQVDPFRAVEPVHREDEVVVRVAAVRERRRRVRHDLRLEAGRRAQSFGDVAGGREELARLAERGPLEREHAPPQRTVGRGLRELAELGAVEIPRLPELVQQPHDLARVLHGIRGELRRDHRVDRPPVRLLEVEKSPEERLGQHALARIPLERDRDELGLVIARPELRDEIVREDLGTTPFERHLGYADREPHERLSSSSTRRARSSTRRSSASLTIRCSANAGSTYQRISLRSTRFT